MRYAWLGFGVTSAALAVLSVVCLVGNRPDLHPFLAWLAAGMGAWLLAIGIAWWVPRLLERLGEVGIEDTPECDGCCCDAPPMVEDDDGGDRP